MRGLAILPLLALLVWTAFGAYWWKCHVHHDCHKSEEVVEQKVDAKKNAGNFIYNLKDGKFSFQTNDGILLDKPNAKATAGADFMSKLPNLQKYLMDNPSKSIEVVGNYTEDEKNSSLLSNMGLARAELVKSWLVTKGLKRNQIKTAANKIGQLKANGAGLWNNAINLKLGKGFLGKLSDDGNKRLSAFESGIGAKPLNLYFETGKNNLVIDDNVRKYLAELKFYLDNKSDKKVSVVGHTDNVGDANKNATLSKERANFVKNLLSRSGINATQMVADGKGQTAPIANNSTADGRAKNRRVEVRLR